MALLTAALATYLLLTPVYKLANSRKPAESRISPRFNGLGRRF